MAPRIADIARAANISSSAVSLVLNNKGGISAGVRQKVIAIAEQMGYKPVPNGKYSPVNENITVKLLRIANHWRIADEGYNAFITEYMEGIESGVQAGRLKLEVSFFYRVPVEEIIASQKGMTADGLIVLGTELSAHELSFFTQLKQPIVFIDTYFPLSVFDCIDMDNADGVFRAIQYLYNNGHRNIGLIKSSYDTRNFRMREYGFREAMEYFSLPVQEKFVIDADPTFDGATNDLIKRLDKCGSLPSAFFCMNDIMAYGCIKALRNQGLRVPEDVSIIGFDDLPSSSLSEPPLTTIHVSTRRIGLRALEKLAERIINHSEEAPENILISGWLVARSSVRPLDPA